MIYLDYNAATPIEPNALQAMQEVLGRSQIIMMDESAGSGVVPYLALPEIQKRAQVAQPQVQGGEQ